MAIRASTLPSQSDWTPDARGQAVLAAIIKEHLRTGEPVGSRTISGRFAGGAGAGREAVGRDTPVCACFPESAILQAAFSLEV